MIARGKAKKIDGLFADETAIGAGAVLTPEYEKNKDQKYYASIDFDKRFYLVIFSAQPKEGDAKK